MDNIIGDTVLARIIFDKPIDFTKMVYVIEMKDGTKTELYCESFCVDGDETILTLKINNGLDR